MATTLRPIRHEDRLSLVEHLDELRTRLIVCVVVFVVAFGFCLWQDDAILDIVNRPLEQTARRRHKKQAPKRPARADGARPGAACARRALGVGGARSTRSPRARTAPRARASYERLRRRAARARERRCRPRRSDSR